MAIPMPFALHTCAHFGITSNTRIATAYRTTLITCDGYVVAISRVGPPSAELCLAGSSNS